MCVEISLKTSEVNLHFRNSLNCFIQENIHNITFRNNIFVLIVDCGLLTPVCNVVLLIKIYIISYCYEHSLIFHQGDSMELETWCLEMNEKWVHFIIFFIIILLFLLALDYNRLFKVLQSSLYCILLSVNSIAEHT